MQDYLLAGYISSPKSHLLLNLISLAENAPGILKEYRTVDDTVLMRYGLAIGQRSAIFLHGSRRNLPMEKAGAGVYFFFVKINHDEVARVELPVWIAQDPIRLDQVHASVLEDSKMLGYPYALIYAHYQIVIPLALGQELNRLAMRAYLEHRGYHHVSAKGQLKG
jgi:hypothetical protein